MAAKTTAVATARSEALLQEIAAKHFHSVERLEAQNSDRLDFDDVAVLAIRAALEAAYAAGHAVVTGPAPASFRSFESITRYQRDRIWQRYTATSSSGMRFPLRRPAA